MIAADTLMVVFRAVHILAGVLWVGSVFLFVMFVQPSAAAIAPAGAPFMAELLGARRLVDRIVLLGMITVAAGAVLYWLDWQDMGSFGDWIGSSFGLSLTIGAISALAALTTGLSVTRPGVRRLLAMGKEVAASGAPPTPEVAAEMAAIQGRLKVFGRVALGLLVFAVLEMAIARYV